MFRVKKWLRLRNGVYEVKFVSSDRRYLVVSNVDNKSITSRFSIYKNADGSEYIFSGGQMVGCEEEPVVVLVKGLLSV